MKRGINFNLVFLLKIILALALVVTCLFFKMRSSEGNMIFAAETINGSTQQKESLTNRPKIIVELDSDRQSEKESVDRSQQQATDSKVAPIIIKAPKYDQSLTLVTLIGSIMLGTGIVFGLQSLKRKYLTNKD